MAGSIRARPEKAADAFELRVYLGRDTNGRVRHQRAYSTARVVPLNGSLPGCSLQRNHSRRPFSMDTTTRSVPRPPLMTRFSLGGTGWEDLSPSTTRRYESIWKVHIEKSIGKHKIVSLGAYDVELYLRGLKAEGLSEASVRQTRAILHRSCRLARKWSGNELANPVADTELPEWKLHEHVRFLGQADSSVCSEGAAISRRSGSSPARRRSTPASGSSTCHRSRTSEAAGFLASMPGRG